MAMTRRVDGVHEGGMVFRVQTALKRGFDPGPVSGVFGDATERTVMQFQTRHDLAASGIVGQRRWMALGFKAAARHLVIIESGARSASQQRWE